MKQSFTVTGMTCGHCERAVTQAVKQADPASRGAHRSQPESGGSRVRPGLAPTLAKAIAEEGYAVAA